MIRVVFEIVLQNGEIVREELAVAYDPEESEIAFDTRAWQAVAAMAGGYAERITRVR